MGGATTICTDKTGTLTTNKMTVVEAFVGGVHYKEAPVRDRLPVNVLGLLVENVCVNSGYDVNIAVISASSVCLLDKQRRSEFGKKRKKIFSNT